jgi:hypothetical protein
MGGGVIIIILCPSLGDNLSLVTWPWPAQQRGKDICLYSEASSRRRASPPVLFKGYWPLLSHRQKLLAGLEAAGSPSCSTEGFDIYMSTGYIIV